MGNTNAQESQQAILLRKLLITQLGLAGIGQREIRSIVGGGMNDINAIVKHLHKASNKKTSKEQL